MAQSKRSSTVSGSFRCTSTVVVATSCIGTKKVQAFLSLVTRMHADIFSTQVANFCAIRHLVHLLNTGVVGCAEPLQADAWQQVVFVTQAPSITASVMVDNSKVLRFARLGISENSPLMVVRYLEPF